MPRPRRQSKDEKPLVLVLTQDTGGVLSYLKALLAQRERTHKVAIRVEGRGVDSRTLVQKAINALGGRSRDLPACDYALVVFDKDDDVNFGESIARARNTNNIESFSSIPCFEYFFLLHFSRARPHLRNYKDVIDRLQKFDGMEDYEKSENGLPVIQLIDLVATAIDHAESTRKESIDERCETPMTEIDLLVKAINLAKIHGLDALRNTEEERQRLRFHQA